MKKFEGKLPFPISSSVAHSPIIETPVREAFGTGIERGKRAAARSIGIETKVMRRLMKSGLLNQQGISELKSREN